MTEGIVQISIDQMIACVEREIGMRERVYPRWVEQKKMLQTTADQELARMRAVRDLLISISIKPDNAQNRVYP